MSTIGSRIKEYRKKKSLTLSQLSGSLGIAVNSLSSIETGKAKPSLDTIESLVNSTEIGVEWLITGEGEMLKSSTPSLAQVLTLAELGELQAVDASAEGRSSAVEVNTAVAIRQEGISMAPTITDGDLVGVSLGDSTPIDNGIFVLRFGTLGTTIRRLRFRAGGYLIVADNPEIEGDFVDQGEIPEGFIVGRVRWILSKV